MNSKFLLGMTAAVCSIVLSAWEIILPQNAALTEKTAAQELKTYLEKSTDSLKVGEKGFLGMGAKEAVFHIGNTDFARQNGIDCEKMENEAWIVKSFDNNIVIAGGERGVLYGVWNFLENHIGIRWWNAFEEYVPEKTDRYFKMLDGSGKPHFLMRAVWLWRLFVRGSHSHI